MSSNMNQFSWPSTSEKVLLQPYEYILKSNGKQIRSKLVKAFNVWLGIPAKECSVISEILEMLHNASLLIDDIEDNSALRRGVPTAHSIFGIPTTLNTGNYIYFLALDKLINGFPPEKVKDAVNIYSQQMIELHRGQGLDIYWRDNFVCPSEEEYLDMIKRKTGGLFNMGVRLMQLFSQNNSEYSSLIELMGVFFQIRDDYANLLSHEYAEHKSYCEDLTEGKFSFPIIHFIRNSPREATLLNIVKQRTKDVDIKRFAVDLMKEFGSFSYTKEKLGRMEMEIRNEVARLGGNSLLSSIMDQLSVDSLL